MVSLRYLRALIWTVSGNGVVEKKAMRVADRCHIYGSLGNSFFCPWSAMYGRCPRVENKLEREKRWLLDTDNQVVDAALGCLSRRKPTGGTPVTALRHFPDCSARMGNRGRAQLSHWVEEAEVRVWGGQGDWDLWGTRVPEKKLHTQRKSHLKSSGLYQAWRSHRWYS